ncbi:hypothetical protein C4559_03100 [Candidatus Microgenomates bacterium]|nr:MAG: hypothetical protein C4559_03100 [Candidatus Microgenomates bacterium]
MIFLARFLSFLFHPVIFFLIMPFMVVYRQTSDTSYAFKWAFFSAVFIFLGTALFLLGRIKGVFSDDDISKREERFRFYFILYFLVFVYFIASFFFKGVFFPLSIIVFGVLFGVLVFDIVNKYSLKASVHVGVACAFITSISIFYGVTAFLVAFWLIPLIFWARIKLKKHTLKEGIAGGFIGIAVTLFTFFLGKYLYLG